MVDHQNKVGVNSAEEDGLSLREIVLEIREDVKLIKAEMPHFVTWSRLATAAATIATLIIGAIKLF